MEDEGSNQAKPSPPSLDFWQSYSVLYWLVQSATNTLILINTCHISVILVKRFCKFIDTMLASDNEIIRLIIRKALLSAQSPIGRNIAILRSMHSIRVRYTCNRHAYTQVLQKACSKVNVSDTVLFVRASENQK